MRRWVCHALGVVALASSGVAYAEAPPPRAPVDIVLDTLQQLDADPAARAAMSAELARQAEALRAELASVEAALKTLQEQAAPSEAEAAALHAQLQRIAQAIAALGAVPIAAPAPAVSADVAEAFEKNIRPILEKHCIPCHGAEKQKAELRLDSRAAMLHGGDTGPAIVPGDAAASALIKAVLYTGDVQMPPDGRLPQADIDALTAWVQAGAPWPDYGNAASPAAGEKAAAKGIDIEKGREWWAFRPVQNVAPSPVRDNTWGTSPIDAFLLARMEAEGLQPSPPAERRTLLRRVTFDLTGLPPTPEEVAAFEDDPAPDAFARVVERLLASPAYGERWGRHWLDVMRYTDSFDSRGSAATDPTEIYKYRDWVVRAFNEDMPFDRFVRYQIAGDILATQGGNLDPEGIIATGALAIGNWPQGDADKQKMVTDIVDDQVDLVCRGFMGVTMACARCHDHKFDPFSTRDYYALAGMFFSSHILPGPGQKTEGSPILFIPLKPKAELDAIELKKARMATLDTQIAETLTARRLAFGRAHLGDTARYLAAARAKADPQTAGLHPELLANWTNYLGLGEFRLMRQVVNNVSGMPSLTALNAGADTPSVTVNSAAEPARFLNIIVPARSVAVHPGPTTPVAVVWQSPIAGAVTMAGVVADIDSSCGDGAAWRADLQPQTDLTARVPLGQGDFENGGKSPLDLGTPVPVKPGDRIVISILPKAAHICDSTHLALTLREAGGEGRAWDLAEDLLRAPLTAESNPLPDARGVAEVWRLVDAAAPPAAPAGSALAEWQSATEEATRAAAAERLQAEVLAEAHALGASAPDPKASPLLAELLSARGPFWIASPPFTPTSPEEVDPLPAIQAELAALRAEPVPPIPMANGIQEGGTPGTEHEGIRDVRVHQRGDYNRLGDIVPRGMPEVLTRGPQDPVGEGSGRLQLADFVASPENPLTARVMVNRIWQHHFGEGLVRTPGNFGAMGERPSHPELLDFLAAEFVRGGWSIKHMHRVMLLSAAYQQASRPSAEARAKDPENRLLSHMHRRRLEAEALRDAMLLVAGKLDATLGGPAFSGLGVPRRTLYFRTVRSDRTTYNMLFDAADPTSIVDKRNMATVAPQALFLLNDQFVLAQSSALAERVPPSPALQDAVARLYQLLFARPPRPEEVALAGELLDSLRAQGQDPKAAWTNYCQTLLATNEFVYLD